MVFSYATARSGKTAIKVTSEIIGDFPTVIYNGCFIVKRLTGEILYENYFNEEGFNEIYNLLSSYKVAPIIYSFINNKERFSYQPNKICKKTKLFLNTRKGDERENPTDSITYKIMQKPFYFSCITDKEKLLPIYDLLMKKYSCIYHKDIYSGDYWLEIMPKNVSKANGVIKLKEILNCERLVTFGDAVNDISMFEVSDECYAVENAHESLKAIANEIIGHNINDSVADWLKYNCIF